MTLDKKRLERNQAKNDQAQKELDDELKEAQEDEGDFIEPDKEKEKPDEKPDKEEEEKEVEDEEDDETPEKEEKSEDEDEDKEESEEDEEDEEEDEEKPGEKIERPKKYIPLNKYQDEKKGWKQDKANLETANKKIAELEKLNKKDLTNAKRKKAVEKLAKKWDTETGFVDDLLDVLDEGNDIKPETIVEKDKTDKKPVEKSEITQDQIIEQFDGEFKDFLPDLKKKYPKANKKQIKEAKKTMDEFAHAPRYNKYPLEDIMKINSKDFDTILGKTPNKIGLEEGKLGSGAFNDISAKSFKKDKEGNYDFASLHKLPEGSKKEAIVDNLSPEAWDAYVDEVGERQDLKVTKNDGRIVNLK